MLYVIRDLHGDAFWSNESGWVDWEWADRFTEADRLTFNLPTHSRWVTVWEANAVQFAELLAKCAAAGVFRDDERMQDVAESMHLDVNEVFTVVGWAQKVWDDDKASILRNKAGS
jgi:hypothetical protein